MDPAVESELDGFSLTFPLPYRVGFIVTLGKNCNPTRLVAYVRTDLFQVSGVGV